MAMTRTSHFLPAGCSSGSGGFARGAFCNTLTNRPIVIPASATVRVQPHMDSRDEVFITFDGQAGFQLEDGDEISICRAERSLRLIHPSTRSYFEVLRQKLRWSASALPPADS